jgi:sulfiredoxin
MMQREKFPIANIYVPVKRRATLEQKRVDELAESMLKDGQQTPILVRADGARFVLVEGLHRLEAARRWASRPSSASGSMPGNISASALPLPVEGRG